VQPDVQQGLSKQSLPLQPTSPLQGVNSFAGGSLPSPVILPAAAAVSALLPAAPWRRAALAAADSTAIPAAALLLLPEPPSLLVSLCGTRSETREEQGTSMPMKYNNMCVVFGGGGRSVTRI